MLKSYLKQLVETSSRGDAREESFYSALETLLVNYAAQANLKQIDVTTLPKATEAGNPDFRVWDGTQHIVGYIEAKSPTSEHLDQIETGAQLKRYLHTFPNLILTNFTEFRLYRDGVLLDKVNIARPFVIHTLKTVPPLENAEAFFKLLEKFFSFSQPKVYDAQTLAVELAKRTRFLKDEVVTWELEQKGRIRGFYEAFQRYLIGGLSQAEFADLYSQTVTYGLFAARTRSQNGFNRKLAYDNIPQTIGILRDIFHFISLGNPPKAMEWIIDDISEVLAVTDANKILHEYFNEGKGADPIIHFYETFLSAYDPAARERRGVYYTPEPVVSYIVRSLNHILKEHFGKTDGFASHEVTVLDPAAGTLTFPAEAAKLAVEEFVKNYGAGGTGEFIKAHILKNFYAFEIMMAPYAIGHLKMAFLLEELGYRLAGNDRVKFYLTNSLEMEKTAQTQIPGLSALSEESHLAGEVKHDQPILVILGNPPYSGHSANKGDWISATIKTYYKINGVSLGEKNPKWLQDDYVKFIRFAQWKIDKAGEGVLGFITNHSYLDNPTFRGMRHSLMKSFDEIYILDLHGNSKKKEKCPDGSKDENVFDIQQGVAIALFVKKKHNGSTGFQPVNHRLEACATDSQPQIYHAELWGRREKKYDWLLKNDLKSTPWQKLSPKSEYYLFIPREEKHLKTWDTYPKVTDIFPVNSVGIVTARDNFVIDFDKDVLIRRINMFCDEKMPDEIISQTFGLKNKTNWSLKSAREQVKKDQDWQKSITRILYRPFDIRWIFYHDAVIERSRREVMRHMMGSKNPGLICSRQQSQQGAWSLAWVANDIIESCYISNKTKEINYLSPLYLYPNLGLTFHRREEIACDYSHFLCTRYITEHGLLSSKTTNSHAPLYLYPNPDKMDLGSREKVPNLNPKIMIALDKAYSCHSRENGNPGITRNNKDWIPASVGMTNILAPEQIFYYIYAVLYSNTYRVKYAEFLKADFPRVPFTANYELFQAMAGYGKHLADLHLLESAQLNPPEAKFQGNGDYRMEKVSYDEAAGRMYINQTQYFEGVTPDVRHYQIGGYQVCDKWLKDRKGRMLSLEEIQHYCRIVTALRKTLIIQSEIDKIYEDVEKEVITM
ncbi:MAG: N-6 DNA methylase [Candidatus Schekmanbacteria bacterium]|nr:N-6 DNA methylase [Candidatus Schekmanbacteria bacterium]